MKLLLKRAAAALATLMLLAGFPPSAPADIAFPSALTIISDEAFSGDASITGLVILPQGVISVGNSAFAGSGIYALDMPASVESVYANAINGNNVNYAIVRNPRAYLAEGALEGVNYVFGEAGSTAEAYARKYGIRFATLETLSIHDGFYYASAGAETILLCAKDATAAGERAVIPGGIGGAAATVITKNAFAGCDALNAVTLTLPISAEQGALSNYLSIKFTTASLGAPVWLSAQARADGAIRFKLSDVPGASGYSVLIAANGGEYGAAAIAPDGETGYMLITGLAPGAYALKASAYALADGVRVESEHASAYEGIIDIEDDSPLAAWRGFSAAKDYPTASAAKSALVITDKNTSWYTAGKIRYVSQLTGKTYHYGAEYWGEHSSDSECTTACFSMIASYMGLDILPGAILDEKNGNTYAGFASILKDDYGDYALEQAVTKQNDDETNVAVSAADFRALYNRYADDDGGYSPILFYSHYREPNRRHAIVIVGRHSGIPNRFYVVDPGSSGIVNMIDLIEYDGYIRIDAYINGVTGKPWLYYEHDPPYVTKALYQLKRK